MLEVTSDILNFSLFLNKSWDFVLLFIKDNRSYYHDDWLQANWEILVESKICRAKQFLYYYGNGGDCYGESSRITFKDEIPTHKIIGILSAKSVFDFYNHEYINELTDYTFKCFLNIENGIDDYKMPFEYVEFEHDTLDKRVWLNKNEIRYYLVPIINL